jgi:hypothetical protein
MQHMKTKIRKIRAAPGMRSRARAKAAAAQQHTRSAALQRLGDLLVGTWKLTGGAEGEIKFEWMDGGFFLIQHFDLLMFHGGRVKGVEVIGHLHRVGEKPSKEIWTRVYSALDGLTLDYVYELEGRKLTIWFVKKLSNNRYVGTFSDDGNSFHGAWAWPGGGYQVTGTRVG